MTDRHTDKLTNRQTDGHEVPLPKLQVKLKFPTQVVSLDKVIDFLILYQDRRADIAAFNHNGCPMIH